MKHKIIFMWHFREPFRLYFYRQSLTELFANCLEWDLQLGWLQAYCYYTGIH